MRRSLLLLMLLPASPAAQTLIEATGAETARQTLEMARQPPHLQCEFRPIAPAMNFSLRFQTGYSAAVPLKQYEGAGHSWIVLSRVTPGGGEPRYFMTITKLPRIPHGVKISGYTGGTFLLGEGSYTIEAMLSDDQNRACFSRWKVQAKRHGAELALEPVIPAGTVQSISSIRIPRENSAAQGDSAPLSVFLQAAPISPRGVQLHTADIGYLTGSLLALMEQSKKPSLRLTIFNLAQKKIIFQDDDFQIGKLDRAVRALNEIQLAVVAAKTLEDGRGPLELIDGMIRQEAVKTPTASTMIFLGPYAPLFGKRQPEPQVHPSAPVKLVYLQFRPAYPNLFRPGFPTAIGLSMATADPADPVENYVHGAGGATLIVRTPHDFADAIERISGRRGP